MRTRSLPKAIPPELQRFARGQETFAALTRSWMARSGWSYATMADLAEAAVVALEANGIPGMGQGPYDKDDLAVANGHVWRAKRDGIGSNTTIPKLNQESEDWERVATVRRIFASQINNLQRQLLKQVSPVIFDSYGLLNKYIEAVQTGKLPAPKSEVLARHINSAVTITDEQGLYGAEEFFSVYLGNLSPEIVEPVVNDQEARSISAAVAKKIREGIQACKLDLIDDWSQFLSCYPTSNPERLARIREVALGLGAWSADQVRDEEAAVAIALVRLASRNRPQLSDASATAAPAIEGSQASTQGQG
jgi:hypothetical protein